MKIQTNQSIDQFQASHPPPSSSPSSTSFGFVSIAFFVVIEVAVVVFVEDTVFFKALEARPLSLGRDAVVAIEEVLFVRPLGKGLDCFSFDLA